MNKILFNLLIIFLCPYTFLLVFAQEKEQPNYEMKTYQMVFLYKGPNRDQDSTETMRIQEGHMANIQRLGNEGKLIVAGPFLDDKDLRGIFIFDSESEVEVKALVETDPAIIAGRLRYEIHPWMTAKGTCFK